MTADKNRYRIKRELGRGGMAIVHLAYDTYREQDVALKVLPIHFLHDPGFRQRFEQEAKMMIKLEHHAIVPVYDFGEQDVQPYIAMRLMKGGSLADRLTEVPFSTDEILPIMLRICAALDKAHSQKIIHRDIKPGNILFDGDGAVYLADFGVARLVEGTMTMTVVGTPQYMAPEQAHGYALDAKTDIYQLGIVLFKMLTGRLPYEADTYPALSYQHTHAPIPSACELNETLPAGYDSIVQRALAKNQNDRFASAGDLAKALQKIANDSTFILPIVITNDEAETEIDKAGVKTQLLSTRSRRNFIIGALLVLLLIIFGFSAVFGGDLFSDGNSEVPAIANLNTATNTLVAIPVSSTAAPTSTYTPDPTETPAITPTNTSSATPTSTDTATPTVQPSDTPLVPTAIPTSAQLPTAISENTTVPNRPPSSSLFGNMRDMGQVNIDFTTNRSQHAHFTWEWNGNLGDGEYLEVRAGKEGGPLESLGPTSGLRESYYDVWLLQVNDEYRDCFDYQWQVVHMAADKQTAISQSDLSNFVVCNTR